MAYSELRWTERPLDMPQGGSSSNAVQEEIIQPSLEEMKNTQFDPSTTALLVVDVQPEYWSQCPAVRKDFPHFPEKLSKAISTCRRKGSKVLFVRADYRYSHSPWLKQFSRIHQGKPAETNPQLTEIKFDPENKDPYNWEEFAKPEGDEVVIAKSSWSSTSNTELIDVLRRSGIQTVLVCGLVTSVCVQHSAFGIFEAGFRTLLITDACGDRGIARHNAALALYGDYMYELITADDLENDERGFAKEEKPMEVGFSSEPPKNLFDHGVTKQWLACNTPSSVVQLSSSPTFVGSV